MKVSHKIEWDGAGWYCWTHDMVLTDAEVLRLVKWAGVINFEVEKT